MIVFLDKLIVIRTDASGLAFPTKIFRGRYIKTGRVVKTSYFYFVQIGFLKTCTHSESSCYVHFTKHFEEKIISIESYKL